MTEEKKSEIIESESALAVQETEEKKTGLMRGAKDFFENTFATLKGKDLNQAVEEFSGEMTLVVEGMSEDLVRKYSPTWSGGGETVHPIFIPEVMYDYFDMDYHEEYKLKVPFTKESWHGRMIACRGVGASLSPDELAKWDAEHRALLANVPDEFDVLHYAATAVLKRK